MKKILKIQGLEVEISKKKGLKNLYLRVKAPNGKITVSAPYRVSFEYILNFVSKKMPQILKIREKVLLENQSPKYSNGEIFSLWGKPYFFYLSFREKRAKVIKIANLIIMIIPPNTTLEQRERIFNNWYKKELKIALAKLSQEYQEKSNLYAQEWRIRNMKTRWGSCNIKKRRIWINLQLVKKPIECLEYVIAHELTHLLEKNHNQRFYDLVSKIYPNWREAEKLLKK